MASHITPRIKFQNEIEYGDYGTRAPHTSYSIIIKNQNLGAVLSHFSIICAVMGDAYCIHSKN